MNKVESKLAASNESLAKKAFLAPLRFAERLRDKIHLLPAAALLVAVPVVVAGLGMALDNSFLQVIGFTAAVVEGLYFLQVFSET